MSNDFPRPVGSSKIPSLTFLEQLESDARRDGFVRDQVRVKIALLVRALREQRGWSQAEFGRVMGKPQPNVSRIEDPDYGKLSLQTLFEVAAAFKLPLYIDMPEWDDWFQMMSDMSTSASHRVSFDINYLSSVAQQTPVMSQTSLFWPDPAIQSAYAKRYAVALAETRRATDESLFGVVTLPRRESHSQAKTAVVEMQNLGFGLLNKISLGKHAISMDAVETRAIVEESETSKPETPQTMSPQSTPIKTQRPEEQWLHSIIARLQQPGIPPQ